MTDLLLEIYFIACLFGGRCYCTSLVQSEVVYFTPELVFKARQLGISNYHLVWINAILDVFLLLSPFL